MPEVRKPAVAGSFYPGNAQEMNHLLDGLYRDLPTAGLVKQHCIAAISPHAGLVYSGSCMASLFAAINVPSRVVVLCPNHTGLGGSRCALSPADSWGIPGANITVLKEEGARLLKAAPVLVRSDAVAHSKEHSIEVLLPFLIRENPAVSILPLALSRLATSEIDTLAKALLNVFGQENVLFLASSDMNHFEDTKTSSAKDHLAFKHIARLDWEGLVEAVEENDISMCGVLPAAVITRIAQLAGVTHPEMIRYTNSGEVTGDTSSVVGYAAWRFPLQG